MGILADLPILTLVLAFSVTLFGGFVKGVVGFGMPLIMISGLATVLSAEVALAALILPTVLSNGMQAIRQGTSAVWHAVTRFRLFLVVLVVMLALSAQIVSFVPTNLMFIAIGISVVAFCLMQLAGWIPRLKPENRARDEGIAAALAGFVGGFSGIWGPPTVAYLTAIETPKAEQMRAQGVVYGIGAVVLFAAHIKSGVVNPYTVPLSLAMLLPAFLGMMLGGRLHDQMPQKLFKRATLIVLTIAGLNLIRKGLIG
ncbi:sulfite exporter TauE/SafE family protein [Aliiroseovarius sp. F20344]|uniref:sulfite exporter TauE/SafE family protein n=1 Tax=Aliiroseovarius sp. F20344 TaxID=2926414 RepID=UPI001FF6291A|nr:sulfite exporter TauE/SafE family protein [Aliiroseovarius sp. F20344]MCK0140924.1 sulfite exporter TauE/SafE family protein [Aliiroseovarius sp. F20344]